MRLLRKKREREKARNRGENEERRMGLHIPLSKTSEWMGEAWTEDVMLTVVFVESTYAEWTSLFEGFGVLGIREDLDLDRVI